ncbi:MAG: non-canonical purine NTP pyrophosphatase rdgB/HAM1 family [Erysipelotrichaceae bacterium]|nr:MAG: non-canonical purine NTP pyrophosphatase rdgB/HAM1 family [Erysipelotrichaceae bacterium]
MKLCLATHNQNKVIELRSLLSDHPDVEILTFNDLDITDEPEENEPTFEGNARLKALWAAQQTGLIALADDSGLEIDALNKEPGVYSARYLGKDTPYPEKNEIILDRLKNISDRSARFISVVAIAFPQGSKPHLENTDIICCEGIMEGHIAYAR